MFKVHLIYIYNIISLFTLAVAQPQAPHEAQEPFHEPFVPDPPPHKLDDQSASYPSIMDSYVSDFVVNEQQGNARKISPNAAMNHNGTVFVVWHDYRNGNQMSFGQIIDSSGNILGPEFQINSVDNNRSFSYPDVTVNDQGDFLVVWQDGRNWNNIYARLYDEKGNPLGDEVNLIDENKRAHQYAPRVAYNNNQFVVVWYDARDGYSYDIYGQRLDDSGTKIDTNFVINDDIQGSRKYGPSIAVNSDGDFLVSWYTTYDSYNNIYAREFNPDGVAKDSTFQLNESVANVSHYTPEVALTDSGYMVVWYGHPGGYYRVWGQLYAQNQGPVGPNLEISDSGGGYYTFYPRVESYAKDELIITWQDSRSGSVQYYGQRMKGREKIDSNILLTDLVNNGNKQYNSLACDDKGDFIQVWIDRGTPMKDMVMARRYSAESIPKGSSFRIDADEYSSNQMYPAIAVNHNGNFSTTWQDERSGRIEIYYQQYTNEGVPVDTNKFAASKSTMYRPDIAAGKDGGFIVTQYEYRSPVYEIVAQRFDNSGDPIGESFIVSTNQEGSHSYTPVIASNQKGEFAITWRQYVDNVYHIYAQLFTEEGDTVGSNVLVSTNNSNSSNSSPRVGIDSTGAFGVVWYSSAYSSNNNYDIILQRYSSEAIPLGDNFIVNDDSTNVSQYYPDIAVHADGDAIVAWQDYRTHRSIYYQKFSNIGSEEFSVVDSNMAISEETIFAQNIRVAMNDRKDFVVGFVKSNGENNDILFKSYNYDGSAHSDLVMISASNEREQNYLDMDFVGDKIYNIWQDNHQMGYGYDIYANVIDWNEMVSNVENLNSKTPEDFSLDQNYPNPFNPNTTIHYTLGNSNNVELTIYNILGQKIATLVNKNQTAGSYSVTWDARGFASGVYYYQLRTDEAQVKTKKMVLLR